MHIAHWNRALAAGAVCLAGIRCLLLPAYGQTGDGGGIDPPPPPFCPARTFESITHLGIQYLNTGDPVPAAFLTRSAPLDDSGQARFRVYGRTDDIRFFCDMTGWFTDKHSARHRTIGLTARLQPAEPFTHGRIPVELVNAPGGRYLCYAPVRRFGPHRETLAFTLRVRHPYRADFIGRFDLLVPGSAGMSVPAPAQ